MVTGRRSRCKSLSQPGSGIASMRFRRRVGHRPVGFVWRPSPVPPSPQRHLAAPRTAVLVTVTVVSGVKAR